MDVDTGEDLGEKIDRARFSAVAWLPDGDAFYYARRLPPDRVPKGEEQFHRRVNLHRLGTNADAHDVEIFGDGRDLRTYYGTSVSPEGPWLLVHATVGTDRKSDVYIADLHLDAPKGRLCVADPATPSEWRTLVAESDAVLSGFTLAGGRLLVLWERDATNRLTVHDVSDGSLIEDVE